MDEDQNDALAAYRRDPRNYARQLQEGEEETVASGQLPVASQNPAPAASKKKKAKQVSTEY